MESRRIASTSLNGLKPIGRLGERDHEQLIAYLVAHPELGVDAAHLFAEPVPARDGSQVDWYVEGDRRSIPLESLDDTRQTAIVGRVSQQLATIRQEGERLRSSGDPLGASLIAASETPLPLTRYIYVEPGDDSSGQSDTPVLVCWAYTDDAPRIAGALPQVMTPPPLPPPFVPDPVVIPPAVVPLARQRGFGWWWTLWPVLTVLLLAIGWLLLRGCGITLFGDAEHGFLYCRPEAGTLAAEIERGRALESSAHRLEMKQIEDRLTCLANTPPPLPKDRWLGKDLSILEGCWMLGHDTKTLVVNDSGKQESCTVRAGKICFGKDGTGTREQTTDCGANRFSVCKVPVKAHFSEAGALETEQPDAKCEPQTITWHSKPNQLTCKRVDDGGALCRDGDNFDHEFRPRATP